MRIRNWRLLADGVEVTSGTLAGFRRIALFDTVAPREVKLVVACPACCASAKQQSPVTRITLRNRPQR